MDTQTEVVAADVVKFMVMNDDHIDHDRLLQHLVTSSPSLLITALEKLIPDFNTSLLFSTLAAASPAALMRNVERHVSINRGIDAALALLRSDEKVPAIKKLREVYGFGLMEAKHLHDALRQVLDGRRAAQSSPSVIEFSAFKDASVTQAYWELLKEWKKTA